MKYFIHLPMKMEPIVSSETSAIKSQTPGNYPKRNKLHLQHGESLRTRLINMLCCGNAAPFIKILSRMDDVNPDKAARVLSTFKNIILLCDN